VTEDEYYALEQEALEAARAASARPPGPEDLTLSRATAAVAEAGAVVVQVRCDRCKGVDPVGLVRRFSGGYVFDGPCEADIPPEIAASLLDGAHAFGQRLPFLPQARTFIILTEPRTSGTEWPPTASCPMHGRADINPQELLKLARAGGVTGRPQRMVVHPSR